MNVDACASLPVITAMSRVDLRIGVSLPGRRCGGRASQSQSPRRAEPGAAALAPPP
jgi:hypothetical protein